MASRTVTCLVDELLVRVCVDRFVSARLEPVTYLGEPVTHLGEPVYALVHGVA